MDNTAQDSVLTAIRKEFFIFRNGLTADILRKGGLEQKYIFGLQLPQIKEISVRMRPEGDAEAASLARALWADRECREGRLLACHIMPPAAMDRDEAEAWARDVRTREEADILSFRLLRYLSCGHVIADTLTSSDIPLRKYTAEAIRRFI